MQRRECRTVCGPWKEGEKGLTGAEVTAGKLSQRRKFFSKKAQVVKRRRKILALRTTEEFGKVEKVFGPKLGP